MKNINKKKKKKKNINDHKLNHKFRDCINQLYLCSLSVERKVHFFMHCYHFSLERQTLINNIKSIG